MANDAKLIGEGTDAFAVLTTLPGDEQARALARAVVERRLAACANVFQPVTSIYWWEGKISEEPETMVVLKTTGPCLEALKQAVLELHPYEVPELVVISLDRVVEPYLHWLRQSTSL
jgi:periplasmic divalent cation tolerance protein